MRTFVTPIDEARNLGAMMLFGEKYGDEVRVVEIPGFSRELCGGTHVRRTAEIGPFVLLSEASVGSGARRIEALTSSDAFAYLQGKAHEAEELRDELARARKEAKKGPKASAEADIEFRDESDGIVTAEVKALKGPALRELSDQIRQSKQANAVLLGSVDDGRAYLVVNLDQRVVEKGADAVSIVKEAAKKIDGGGGGKPTLAEAGGKNPDGLAEAYEVGRSEIASALERLKVLALDYGSARTGVAVSDPTGTVARPVGVVEHAGTEAGLARLVGLIREHEAERVVVGLPLTMGGVHGEQAAETDAFVTLLRNAIDVPIESFDERFTTDLAEQGGGGSHPTDARAAAHLLSSYLTWSSSESR